MHLCFDWLHHKRLLRCWTNLSTVSATGTVKYGYLNFVLKISECLSAHSLLCCKSFWSVGHFFFIHKEWSDDSVRTYVRTLVTLDTVFNIPFRNIDSDSSLFVSGSSHWESSIFSAEECGYRKSVSFLCIHWLENVLDEIRNISFICLYFYSVGPFSRNRNLHKSVNASVDGFIVHVDDLFTLLAIGINHRLLQILHSIFYWDDVRKLEECGLHNHVDSGAKTNLSCDRLCVYDVEVDVLLGDILLHLCWKMCI